MDKETTVSYETAIEKQRNLVAELEEDEEWEMAGDSRECLDELVDEYEYLKNDESAFQEYLAQQHREVNNEN